MRAGAAGLMKVATGGAPSTETVAVSACTSKAGTVTGGPSNDTAGAITALSDGSDATYIANSDTSSVQARATVGFADLTLDAGRQISSFTITLRARATAGSGFAGSFTFTGVTPSPASDFENATGSFATYVNGPYTKSGGGNWTASDINALTCIVYGGAADDGNFCAADLAAASLTVTYA